MTEYRYNIKIIVAYTVNATQTSNSAMCIASVNEIVATQVGDKHDGNGHLPPGELQMGGYKWGVTNSLKNILYGI